MLAADERDNALDSSRNNYHAPHLPDYTGPKNLNNLNPPSESQTYSREYCDNYEANLRDKFAYSWVIIPRVCVDGRLRFHRRCSKLHSSRDQRFIHRHKHWIMQLSAFKLASANFHFKNSAFHPKVIAFEWEFSFGKQRQLLDHAYIFASNSSGLLRLMPPGVTFAVTTKR